MDFQELLRGRDACACGRAHRCPIDSVRIGPGALASLGELCEPYRHILLLSDANTYRACGEAVHQQIADRVETNRILLSNGDTVIPNEEKIEEIEACLTDATDLLVGVGSGVINDLCKYVSHKHGLRYFIVATAPSMDGYASVGAALVLGGMKVTRNARPPKAIVADTTVLKAAPMEMLRAGYGDIIGKFSCLNDWKLSALINGEYFCPFVYGLTYSTALHVKELAQGVCCREEAAVEALMEALVAVGIAMSYVDCSRPASGSEHHLAHFFEITGILDQTPYFAHGTDVAYASVETAKLRERILASYPQRRPFDRAAWEREIRRVYTSCANGVIALQSKLGWYEQDDLACIESKWEEICAVLAEAPTAKEFEAMLAAVGLDITEFYATYGDAKIADAVRYGKDLKDRYTVLWLYDRYFADAAGRT